MNHWSTVLGAVAFPAALAAQCYEANTGLAIGSGDDVVLAAQSLGFAFPFAGTTFTDVHVSTNGFVWLSNGGVPAPGGALCCAGTAATLVAGSPMLAPYWTDLDVLPSLGGAVEFAALPGKAVVTWRDVVEVGDQSNARFTLQLQLFASGDAVFAYDGRCAVRTIGDVLVGMSEGGGAAIPAASDFAFAGSTATPTCFELFRVTGPAFDLAGASLTFLPSGGSTVWFPAVCAASHASFGAGCYAVPASFYELFAPGTFDLAGTSLTMTRSGTGYAMAAGGATFVPPGPGAITLPLGDDSEVWVGLATPFPYAGGTTSFLTIAANGHVSVGQAGNGTAFTPDAGTFLQAPNTGWWSWHDFDPTAGGAVRYELAGGVHYVTWAGVWSHGTSSPETMQMQFDTATGTVRMVWTTISNTGNGWLVGWSPGGPSLDPGSQNLSAALPATFTRLGADVLPLELAASARPIVGSTVLYTTSRIPEFAPGAGVYIALAIFSTTPIPAPGIDLGVLGMPGCPLLVGTLDATLAAVAVTDTAPVAVTFPAPAPIGAALFAQSAALFTPGSLPTGQNAFGATTSNALAITVGLW